MSTMFGPVFRTIYKKKEAKICMLFSLFPLLLIVTSFLPRNFMKLNGVAGSMSCMEFFEAVVFVQFQLTLPSIAFMYLAVTCIYDEIHKGRLYLYKDISKIKIFGCKGLGLIVWYLIYLGTTFLTSVFTYYVYVSKLSYASGAFLPTKVEDLQYIVIGLMGTVLTFVISLLLVTVLSTFLNNGTTLIIGILFSLFSSIAPSLDKINMFFPTGFLYTYENIGFKNAVIYIFLLSVVYIGVIVGVGKYKVTRIEY